MISCGSDLTSVASFSERRSTAESSCQISFSCCCCCCLEVLITPFEDTGEELVFLIINIRVCSMNSQSPLQSAPFEAFKAHRKHHQQPLCADREGFGPLSPFRFDLTPCFLDLLLVFVAAWGALGGSAAIVYLTKKRTPSDVRKNWHYYTKL